MKRSPRRRKGWRAGKRFLAPSFLFLIGLLGLSPIMSAVAVLPGKPSTVEAPPGQPDGVASLAREDSWMGLYLHGLKMGYSHLTVEPGPNRKTAGKDARSDTLKISSNTVIKVAVLGQSLEQRIDMDSETTHDGKPLTMKMVMSSGGHETIIEARFEREAVRCAVRSGGTTTPKIVPIPKGVTLDLDPELTGRSAPPVGSSREFHYFNPANLSIEKGTVETRRRESATINGITSLTTVVATASPMGTITSWLDRDGRVLKSESVIGLTMVSETKEMAQSLPSEKRAPPADLAKALAVSPGRELKDPRNLSRLVLRLAAPDIPDPIDDDRQSFRRIDKDTVELTVSAETLDEKSSVTVAEAGRKEVKWTKPEPYLPSDNPAIRSKSREVAGRETNAFWAAMKLRDWVHRNMEVQASIGVLRSGVDILKDRRGVCRDFAILYSTLARSVGIPTRVASGLVYADGAFYYHAWAESYVGKWIDIDPTLPTAFVDATHLKLAHGAAESMLSTARVMGQLRVEVLESAAGKRLP